MNNFIANLSTAELALLASLIVGLCIQLYYYLWVFTQVSVRKKPKGHAVEPSTPPVSVVICARNEEDNLRNFLPKVLEQDYPDFEVVVVNDCSTDGTDMLLSTMLGEHPRLRVTSINENAKFMHNKKLALTVGIKSAKHEWLLLTDADCHPESPRWLASMAERFVRPNEIVIGYGGYTAQPGLLNKLIRFDTMFNAMAYLGFAINHHPYMAVGRNLAYNKELFFRNRGFASHSHIASGDDDLFVRDAANGRNTAVCLAPESFTRSVPCSTYKEWIKQKTRHISTSAHYRLADKMRIVMEPISRLVTLGTAIALLAMGFMPLIIAIILIIRYLIQLLVIKGAMKRLNEKKLLLISPLWDFYSLYLYIKLHLLNKLTPKRTPAWR